MNDCGKDQVEKGGGCAARPHTAAQRISDEEAFLFQWGYVISGTIAPLEIDSEMESHPEC